MEPTTPPTEPQSDNNTPAMEYVKSLRDPLKRRFASNYLTWVTGGRVGPVPARGTLAHAIVKNVCANLDALA